MHLFKVFSLQNWCNFLTNSLSLNKHIFQFLHFSGCTFDELIGLANHVITSFIQKIWQMNEKRKIIRHAIQMHPSDPFYLRATPFSNKFPFFKSCNMQMMNLHIIIAICVSYVKIFFIIFYQWLAVSPTTQITSLKIGNTGIFKVWFRKWRRCNTWLWCAWLPK